MSEYPGFDKVNLQIVDAVNKTNEAVISGNVPITSSNVPIAQGKGTAFQLVAMASAHAFQNATNYLQAISLISTAAAAVATKNMVEKKDATWEPIIKDAMSNVDAATKTMKTIGTDAAEVMTKFST